MTPEKPHSEGGRNWSEVCLPGVDHQVLTSELQEVGEWLTLLSVSHLYTLSPELSTSHVINLLTLSIPFSRWSPVHQAALTNRWRGVTYADELFSAHRLLPLLLTLPPFLLLLLFFSHPFPPTCLLCSNSCLVPTSDFYFLLWYFFCPSHNLDIWSSQCDVKILSNYLFSLLFHPRNAPRG